MNFRKTALSLLGFLPLITAASRDGGHASVTRIESRHNVASMEPSRAQSLLVRPRRYAPSFANYRGHALMEPIDSVSSLVSMFTSEALGSCIVATFTLGIATMINLNIGIDAVGRVLAISFTFMFAIMVAIATDSTLALNPAASLTALLLNKISVLRLLVSVAATTSGWITGGALAKGIMGELVAEIGIAPGYSVGRAFAGELLATVGCLVTIFSTNLEKGLHRPLAPLYIGSSFFLAHMLLVDRTGASLNPSRALAPSIVNGNFPEHFWISQVPQYLASIATAAIVTAKKYILEKEAESKRRIDPALVESNAPIGREVLLTDRNDENIDDIIRREAQEMMAQRDSLV